MEKAKQYLVGAALAMAALALLGTIGSMDVQDAEASAAYCKTMVEQGAWPEAACHE